MDDEDSIGLIDDLELQIARLSVELKRLGADHRYIPLLVTAPRYGWINAFTAASEVGDIERFPSPAKLCGYTGLCPRVIQSGSSDRRGPISSTARAICAGRCSRPPSTRGSTRPTPSATSTPSADSAATRPRGRPERFRVAAAAAQRGNPSRAPSGQRVL
jgi:hypothetical protein